MSTRPIDVYCGTCDTEPGSPCRTLRAYATSRTTTPHKMRRDRAWWADRVREPAPTVRMSQRDRASLADVLLRAGEERP